MNTALPTLVVVGRVNRGKSSILSTLAEDDSVVVSPEPGTTTEVRAFPVRIDGEPLFRLVDTPGFENARGVLAYLHERAGSAAARRQAVADFVDVHAGGAAFRQECKLLRPILEGGAILYVVDGSIPYRTNYEAEMEILRWTGQPRMALINRTGERDCVAEWRAALDQFFSVVRVFDAHQAGFAERVGLFRALRELSAEWQPAFDRAIDALGRDWERRTHEAARMIAEMLADQVTHTRSIIARPGEGAAKKRDIEKAFHDDLRQREHKEREAIETLYLHRRLRREEGEMAPPVLDRDLFSKETWRTLGLSFRQLLGVGVVAGAATGGTLDAMTGGASFGAGAAFGGIMGGGAAIYLGSRRLASAGDFGRFFRGGQELVVGPHRNPNFPWVLLDRALLHYVSVRDRAHGKRDPLRLNPSVDASGPTGIVTGLTDPERRRLARAFGKLQSGRTHRIEEGRWELEEGLRELLPQLPR